MNLVQGPKWRGLTVEVEMCRVLLRASFSRVSFHAAAKETRPTEKTNNARFGTLPQPKSSRRPS
jgi:hypothetical protein